MKPNIYLAYLVFLGLDQEMSGQAYAVAEAFNSCKRHELLYKFGSSTRGVINAIAYTKKNNARMNFLLSAEQDWAITSSESFLKFLKTYGFEK